MSKANLENKNTNKLPKLFWLKVIIPSIFIPLIATFVTLWQTGNLHKIDDQSKKMELSNTLVHSMTDNTNPLFSLYYGIIIEQMTWMDTDFSKSIENTIIKYYYSLVFEKVDSKNQSDLLLVYRINHQAKNTNSKIGNEIVREIEPLIKYNTNYDRYKNAVEIEERAFDQLLKRNIDSTIILFQECNNIYPEFHNASEISGYLSKLNKNKLDWGQIDKKILTDYSWGMPDKYRNELSKRL